MSHKMIIFNGDCQLPCLITGGYLCSIYVYIINYIYIHLSTEIKTAGFQKKRSRPWPSESAPDAVYMVVPNCRCHQTWLENSRFMDDVSPEKPPLIEDFQLGVSVVMV